MYACYMNCLINKKIQIVQFHYQVLKYPIKINEVDEISTNIDEGYISNNCKIF